MGSDGLLDEDCHLGECNLGDLEDTSGIKETYWLLAIKEITVVANHSDVR